MVEIDQIFRSIINIRNDQNNETISQKDLVKNFRSLQLIIPSPPEEKAYNKLYHFILDYYKKCDSSDLELPSFEFIKNHFETVEGSEAVLSVLDRIRVQQPYVGQDFRAVLRQYNEDQRTAELGRVLNNASKVATTGMEEGRGRNKVKLYGVLDAINYIARNTKDLTRSMTGVKTEGQIVSNEDSKEMIEQYEKAEADPTESIGINTWLREIDDATGGLKNSELMIVGGFTGHCKTTFAINMAYRALYGGWNTAFITLEMSFDEIRRKMYVLHACNPRFKEIYPEYAHLVGKITYNNVLYGRLNQEEKAYWYKVCKDFDKNVNCESDSYGRFFVWQPEKSSTTVSDIDLKCRQYQQELAGTGRELEFIVIDYISLMGADAHEKVRDPNETTNNIIKSLKRLCLTFNNGKGVRILSPHQINRDGYKEALKNEGLYNLTALSNTHEAERSGDLIISTFKFDEGNDNNRIKLCNLKNRRNSSFKPFDACIDYETGFIYNFTHSIEESDSIIDVSEVV